MRCLVLGIYPESDSESDYETAVDMSHWSMHQLTYRLETPYGLLLSLIERHESVTHSYMEPDFDHLEGTGEVVYERHADKSNDSETVSYLALVYYPLISERISRSDPSQSYYDEEDERGLASGQDVLGVSAETIQRMIAGLEGVKKGSTVDLCVFDDCLTACIRHQESNLAAIRAKNLEIHIHNLAEAAIAEIFNG